MKNFKKVIALLLSLVMILSCVPNMAYAAPDPVEPEFYVYGDNFTNQNKVESFTSRGYTYYEFYESNINPNTIDLHVYLNEFFPADGDGVTYQWKYKAPGASLFENIDGATSKDYTITLDDLSSDGCAVLCEITYNGETYTTYDKMYIAKNGGSILGNVRKGSGEWYITNGSLAYAFVNDYKGNPYALDVLGKIKGVDFEMDYDREDYAGKEFFESTSYDEYWDMYFSNSDAPSPVGLNEPDTHGYYASGVPANIRFRFNPNNEKEMPCTIDLNDGYKSFAFGCDTEFCLDECALDLIEKKGAYNQVQLVGVQNLDNATLNTPSYVARFDTTPSHVWLGEYAYRQAFANNGSGNQMVKRVVDSDSGMVISYANMTHIDLTFLMGTVAETGAVAPCSANTTTTSIIVENTNEAYCYAVFKDSELVKDWVQGNGKDIVFTDLEENTEYIVKTILKTDLDQSIFDNVEESNAKTKFDPMKEREIDTETFKPSVSSDSTSIRINNPYKGFRYELYDEEGNQVVDYEFYVSYGFDNVEVETGNDDEPYGYILWKGLETNKKYTIRISGIYEGNSASGQVEISTRSSGSKKYKAKDTLDTGDKISGTGKKGSTRTITTDTNKKLVSIIVKDKDGNIIDLTDNEDGTYSFKQPASDVTVEIKYEEPTKEEKLIEELMKDDVKRADSNEGKVIDPDAKFINGYEDGTFLPNRTVSNIELMSMVTELFTDAVKGNGEALNLNQGDNAWADEIIKAANKLGLVPGDKNDPNYNLADEVTRADLAVVIYDLIKDYTESSSLVDSCLDAKGKSYEKAVAKLVELGVLKGYDDGLFHGENTLTRAEAVVVINRALRSLGFEITTPSITKSFPDLTPSHWAYYEIMFAANK